MEKVTIEDYDFQQVEDFRYVSAVPTSENKIREELKQPTGQEKLVTKNPMPQYIKG